MIRIEREELPAKLSERLNKLTAEIATAELERRATKARGLWQRKSTREQVYQPLRGTLQRMAPGLGRCMYCGESYGADIDHFEPISRNPLGTFAWSNHLLACATCNSHKKGNQFPVDDEGRPLLIDPTKEDPFEHLRLVLSAGLYVDKTPNGLATIEICDPNRWPLPRARLNARTNVESCLLRWVDASDHDKPTAMHELIRTVREQPCAEVCQAMLRLANAPGPGAEIIFRRTPRVLAMLRSSDVQAALL